MIYGSVCSGIKAATVAWHPLGWRPAFFSEIDEFPQAVLQHHYPDVPLHGDFTTIEDGDYDPIDLLVGGTPCQSFSIAGLRGGLDDDRGNLSLEYLKLADRLRPRWLVWENVPGVLSSNDGRDFGSILGGMAELGYGWAYRVLDAQYIRVDGLARAVPQRRRRVFVVGYLGDWRRAAAVLFERESMQGHPPPRREAGKGIAPTISARPTGGGGLGTDFDLDGGLVAHTLRGKGFDASEDGTGRGTPIVVVANSGNVSHCITASAQQSLDAETETLIAFDCKGTEVQVDTDGSVQTLRSMSHAKSHQNAGGQVAVCFDTTQITSKANYSNPRPGDPCHPLASGAHAPAVAFTASERSNGFAWESDIHPTLQAYPQSETSARQTGVRIQSKVRRLTPTECERLQGFPDGYTQVSYRGKPAADGPRYKALGNSMPVNAMRWIGQRIDLVERMTPSATVRGDTTQGREM